MAEIPLNKGGAGVFPAPLSFQSGLLDSNQRPRAPQTCALPTALNPDPFLLGTDLLNVSFCRMRVQKYTVFSEYANIWGTFFKKR